MKRLSCTLPRRHSMASAAIILMIAATALLADASPAAAQGNNVTITPTRVVFEGRDRSKELILINRGSKTVTYRISLIGMSMAKNGRLSRSKKPQGGEKFAHKLLRFAPRQVELKPGVAQRVRVIARKPSDLAEGEYRSHMLFQAVPESATSVEEQVDDKKLALRLNIISGVSIPAIVRHGKLSAKAKIKDLEIVEGSKKGEPDRVEFDLLREGEKSLYGNITVKYFPESKEAKPITIAKQNGVAVYTTHKLRKAQIGLKTSEGLDAAEGVKLDGGRIVVTYRERSEDGGALLASEELSLP